MTAVTLDDHRAWRRVGDELVRHLELRDFDEAMRCLERVAECVDDYGRRPDMCINCYNHVRLVVSNPHHAGITQAELRLIAKVDSVLGPGTPAAA
jgi:pterin-4a-carbinolamine dehydratase